MIEPQNTMLPLAAEPRPAKHTQGESGGFGEMLAQTLGLVTQVDPNAIQQIPSQPEQRGQGEEQAGGQGSSEQGAPVVTSRIADLLARSADATGPGPFEPVEANPVDGRIVKPIPEIGFPEVRPGEVAPVGAGPAGPRLPETPQPVTGNWVVEPDAAGAGVPAQTAPRPGEVEEISPPIDSSPAPAATATPPDPVTVPPVVGDPAPRPAPVGPPADPVVAPPPTDVPVDPPRRRLDPGLVTPADGAGVLSPSRKTDPLRRPPTLPTPPGDLPVGSAAEGEANVPQPAAPRPTSAERIQLAPETPIRLGPAPRVGSENLRPVETGAAPLDGLTESPVVAPGATTASSSATPATGSATVATVLSQSSVLAERVMRAVDLQRTQPPPRSMVVDIPEVEGLRLVVSVRSGGQVTVTPASSSANPDAFVPFADDLSRVLADRGFVMNGDDRRRGHQPSPEDDANPQPAARSSYRRRMRVDNDLRI